MKRIAIPLLITVLLLAANSVFGQQAPRVLPPLEWKGPEWRGNVDSTRNSVTFAPPSPGGVSAPGGGSAPRGLPAPSGVPAKYAPPVAHNTVNQAVNQPVTQVAAVQSTVTQNHQLRIPPQAFERNLVEKLESRFVPIRSNAEIPGISRYRLPAKDGTDIELAIYHQQGIVSIVGTPGMVASTLQIVRLLDTADVPGSAVTRFLPVQPISVEPARRVANLVNQETHRVAQADRPAPSPVAATQGNEELLGGGVVGPVRIEVIQDLNTMVIQGNPRDVERIKAMLQQLEALSQENEPIIELIPLQHADSQRVTGLVQQLYQVMYLNRRGAVTMLALIKPNTILIIGRKESIEGAKELIDKLDTPVRPDTAFRIFPLKYASAQDLGTQITQSFSNRQGYGVGLSAMVVIVPDTRTNALIAQANPRDLEEIAAMIRQMDVPGSDVTTLVKTFPLKHAMVSELANILQSAFQGSAAGLAGQRASQLSLGGVDAEGNLIRSSVLHNVTLAADVRSNTLIVTAPPETMFLVADLIHQLDRPPAAESKIKVFTLANGDAYNLAQVLTSLFQTGQANQVTTTRPGIEEGESSLVGARFQAEIRTNSIIAIGGEADLIIAEALLMRLDSENLNNRKIFTMKLVNTPAEELAPILSNYFVNERNLENQNAVSLLPQSPLEQYQKEINIVAEPITNSLIITTSPRHYEMIRQIILGLDERPLMVAIDMLIAEVSISNSKDRGVELGLQDSILFSAGAPVNNFFSTSTGSVGTQGITRLGTGTSGPTGGAGGFAFSASSESVSIFIRALETYNKTQILSRPRLVTLHNNQAQIQVGQTVPYPGGTTITQGIAQTSIQERDTGTYMDVTPRIMPDGMISIALYVSKSSIARWRVFEGSEAPEINETYATTTVNAMDGQTVIFAGLIADEKTTENRSIPGLNKIPVIKHLFEYDKKESKRSELLIVMTPRIIRTQEDMAFLNQQERERMHWCLMDVVKLTGDQTIMRRSDDWSSSAVPHHFAAPVILNESQLPAESKKPMPVPIFPVIEAK